MTRGGLIRSLAALGVAATLTVALTQSTTSAAFTATTADSGNQVSSATTFCSAPGQVDTLNTGVDTGLYESQPTTNFNSHVQLGVISSSSAVARSLIKFTLLPRPSGCVVTSAVLTLRVSSGTAGSTVQVYRAAAAWNPTTVTWTTDPGFTGTAVTTTSGANGALLQWNVAAHVTALYAGPDYGFELKDAAEGVGNNTQLYDSMNATTPANWPKLTITWG